MQVSNGDPRRTRPRPAGGTGAGGLGLALMAVLASRHGLAGGTTGKTIWYEL